MWIYFYISKERIAQIAHQVNPGVLREHIKRWDIKGSLQGALDAEASKLMELMGVKGKVSTSGEAEGGHSSETKFTPTDEVIVDNVRKYLHKLTPHTNLSQLKSTTQLGPNTGVIEFEGRFRPEITTIEPTKAIAEYEAMAYVSWKGMCGHIAVRFVTSKRSLVSQTPVVQCLMNPEQHILLKGFGTLLSDVRKEPLAVLPLFLGLEFSV